MRRVADGGVREVGRRRRGQDSRGRELQRRVWRGAPRRYNCKERREYERFTVFRQEMKSNVKEESQHLELTTVSYTC